MLKGSGGVVPRDHPVQGPSQPLECVQCVEVVAGVQVNGEGSALAEVCGGASGICGQDEGTPGGYQADGLVPGGVPSEGMSQQSISELGDG